MILQTSSLDVHLLYRQGIIYRLHHNKSRKHAVIGMAAGTVLTTAAACLMNAFVLLPAYGKKHLVCRSKHLLKWDQQYIRL